MKVGGSLLRGVIVCLTVAGSNQEHETSDDEMPIKLKLLQPRLTMVVDQHSVGWAAGHFLMNHLKLRLFLLYDPSHRVARDLYLALGDTGFWEVVMLQSIAWNINWGPWDGSAFWRQVQESAENYRCALGHSSCPLFQSMLWQIARDRDELDQLHSPEWRDMVWDEVFTGRCITHKGPKMALCRWMSFIDCEVYWRKLHNMRLLLFTVWGISLGYIDENADSKQLRLRNLMKAPGDAEKTSIRQGQAIVNRLRDTAKNSLHVSTIILADPILQRKGRILSECCSPSRGWHGAQAQSNRCSASLGQYYLDQASGKGLQSVAETADLLQDCHALSRMHFRTDAADLRLVTADLSGDLFIEDEDQWLASFASLLFRVAYYRCVSNLWHTDGFPGLFALFNSPDDAVVEGALAKMQSHWKAWQQALDHSHTPFIKKGTDRSYMSQVAISEAFEVAAHYEFKGAELKGILKEFAADAFILGYTKLVEDAFQRVRGKETTQHPNHVMSHEAVWKAPIIKHVLDEVHKYQAISHEDCPARERISVASSLNPSMFKGHPAECGVNLKDIVGTKPKTDWATFTHISGSIQYADMALWHHCEQHGSWDQASLAWLNTLVVPGTLLSRKGQNSYAWALGHVRGTATLVWPAVATEIGGKRFFTLASARDTKADWIVCVEPDDWEALEVHWCSPMHIMALQRAPWAGPAASALSGGLLRGAWAMARGGPVSLWAAAARKCFDKFGEVAITEFIKYLGVDIPGGCGFFEKLKILVSHCLPGISEEELLEILHLRVQQPHAALTELLSEEVVQQTFQKDDLQMVEKFVESRKSEEKAALPFREELKQFTARIFSRTPEPPAKKRQKKAASGSKHPESRPAFMRVPPTEESAISQEVAQTFFPPNAKVWKDSLSCRWKVVYKPFGSLSRSWKLHGDAGSLKQVAAWAWHQSAEAGLGKSEAQWLQGVTW